jgi:hypothetical protein
MFVGDRFSDISGLSDGESSLGFICPAQATLKMVLTLFLFQTKVNTKLDNEGEWTYQTLQSGKSVRSSVLVRGLRFIQIRSQIQNT